MTTKYVYDGDQIVAEYVKRQPGTEIYLWPGD